MTKARDLADFAGKADTIETSATADQTAAEIRAAVEAATDSNVFTDADHTKLNAIEASSTGDQTAAQILTAIKTVDGAASALDADLLDGQHGAYYTGYADTAISNLVDSSPASLNTLNELASALGDDASFSTTVTNSIAAKLPLAGGTMSGAIAMGTSKITGAGNPTAAQDLATKAYVDGASGAALPLSGGALTGAVTTNSTFDGVDVGARDSVLTSTTTTANAALPKAGGAMTGAITTNSTFDGVDIATRDGVLTTTTNTANAALPKAGGTLTGPLNITQSSTADTIRLTRGATSNNSIIKFKTGSADKWIIGQRNDSTDHLRFYSYGTSSDVLSIQTDGNVGFGTTTFVDASKFQFEGAKTFSSGIPRGQVNIVDTTAVATGVGGSIGFVGNYSGTSKTTFGSIEGSKTNGTGGHYGGALVLRSRNHGGNLEERIRLDADGLKFHGDTAAGNGLNDYETGLWSPTVTTASSVTVNRATYTKVGGIVHIQAYIVWVNNQNNNSGMWYIGGLPFNTRIGSSTYGAISVSYCSSAVMTDTPNLITSQNNGSYLYAHRLDGNGSARTNAQMTTKNLTQLIFGGSYQTSA